MDNMQDILKSYYASGGKTLFETNYGITEAEEWHTHNDLANIILQHTKNLQLARDFNNMEEDFLSQDDVQSSGLTGFDQDPLDYDRERVNRILRTHRVPVKVLKMKQDSEYNTLYSILQSAINEITTGTGTGSKYGVMGKPEWYDQAVALKKANPRITFAGLSRELDVSPTTIGYWLTGQDSGSFPRMKREVFPFSPSDFPNTGAQKYFDGAKPEWYDPALQMAKAGATFTAIAKKFGIRSIRTVSDWLTKGRKNAKTGKIINPDAELEPRKPRVVKVDAKLLMDFISDGYTDADIIELIADEKGPRIASQVKNMLPVLRQKQNPGMQTIDKTRTGSMRDPDITGLVK